MSNNLENTSARELSTHQRTVRWQNFPDLRVYEYLPTYEHVTTRRPWHLIAPSIRASRDIVSACCVSKDFHKAFTPLLWGSPGKHFGDDEDERKRKLQAFFTCVEIARLSSRQQVHTLDLVKMRQNYRSLQFWKDWLPKLFHLFPSIQVVNVSDIRPLIERGALETIWSIASSVASTTPFKLEHMFGLRMLTLKNVKNMDAEILGKALGFFPNLIYLDLSDTQAAGEREVTKVITRARVFKELQILKLRNIGLTNDSFYSILLNHSPKLWSLDVRNNKLSDDVTWFRPIVSHGFVIALQAPPSYHSLITSNPATNTISTCDLREVLPLNDRTRFSATAHRRENIIIADTEEYVRSVLGQYPAIDIGPKIENGLTHLYVANNRLSWTAIQTLLERGRLRVLDAGTILFEKALCVDRCNQYSISGREFWRHLNKISEGSLRSLRMNHHIVTGISELRDSGHKECESVVKMGNSVGWPTWNTTTPCEEHTVSQHMIKELTGVRVLRLSDIPPYSALGWTTRALIDFITALGQADNTLEHLYLEITTNSPDTHWNPFRPIVLPSEKSSVKIPTKPTRPSMLATTMDFPNPYIGDVESKIKDFLRANKPWKGNVTFQHPGMESWGPSSIHKAKDAKKRVVQLMCEDVENQNVEGTGEIEGVEGVRCPLGGARKRKFLGFL